MIPLFDKRGNLPPGIHEANWNELEEDPGDFDACWDAVGVAPDGLDPVLLDFSAGRKAQRERFGGELFPADTAAEPAGTRFLDYFQRDRETGEPKGIVQLDLEVLA